MTDETKKFESAAKRVEEINAGLGGLLGNLGGLGNLLESLGKLSENAEALNRSGGFQTTINGKEVRGNYGVRFKVGLNPEETQNEFNVEPIDNAAHGTASDNNINTVHEPIIDLFEEENYWLLVAELPGIRTENITLEVHEETLILQAENGEKKYHKVISLPETLAREKMTVTCNNGVVEIRCVR